jgi:hypothetical protein
MHTTITAPPSNIVHPGASVVSNPAATSHADMKAKVAITSRASCEAFRLAAAASATKITTSADTLNRPGQSVTVFLTEQVAARTENLPETRRQASKGEGASELLSADSLSQGNDDPLWPAHVSHAPDVLVLTDAADQAVAVRSRPVDRRLQVVDFE